MSDKERPLPKPPNKAFGRKSSFEQDEQGTLLADRMAAAAAEGRLDEFLRQEMPDNEYARNLASMMMGMTGMVPNMTPPAASVRPKEEQQQAAAESQAQQEEIPEDVRSAIVGGDIQGLMNLLKREHEKRNPDSPLLKAQEQPEESSTHEQPSGPTPTIDKETIDTLVKIALDNSVTLDWIILRAIKLYVQEYRKTGRL